MDQNLFGANAQQQYTTSNGANDGQANHAAAATTTNATDLLAQTQNLNELLSTATYTQGNAMTNPAPANQVVSGLPATGLAGATMPLGNLGAGLEGVDLKSLGLEQLLGSQFGAPAQPQATGDAQQQQSLDQSSSVNTANLLKGIPGLPENLLAPAQTSMGSTTQGTAGKESAASKTDNAEPQDLKVSQPSQNLLQNIPGVNLQNILSSNLPTTEQLDINKILQGIPGVPNISGLVESIQPEMKLENQLSALHGLPHAANNWPQLQLSGITGAGIDLNNLGANPLFQLGMNPAALKAESFKHQQMQNAGLQNLSALGVNFGHLGHGLPGFAGLGPPRGIPGYQGGVLVPGSAAHAQAFQVKGPENELKLFVGGLAFITQEPDMINYFKQYGTVADAIVMRDRQTQRGRGFGFVKMQFENVTRAQEMKAMLLEINKRQGHVINDKIVDVKSADDYKKDPNAPQGPQHHTAMMNQQRAGNEAMMMNQHKPNPYVIVAHDQKEQDGQKNFSFKYPKSKIFVGGLDFKLSQHDLLQHFSQFGEIENAVILKDIHTGQSRGFGFVMFKNEGVAQHLINDVRHTNIFGRKVDIKSAEPKHQQSGNGGGERTDRSQRNQGERRSGYQQQNQRKDEYSTIPAYGGAGTGDAGGDQKADNRDRKKDDYESPKADSQGSEGRTNRRNKDRRRDDDRDRATDYRREDKHRDRRRADERRSREKESHRGGSRDRYDHRRRSRERRRRYSDSSDDSSSYYARKDRSSRKERRRGPHHEHKSDKRETDASKAKEEKKD